MAYTGFGNLAIHEQVTAKKALGGLLRPAKDAKRKGTRVVWERPAAGFAFSTPFSHHLVFQGYIYSMFSSSKVETFYIKRNVLTVLWSNKYKPVVGEDGISFRRKKAPYHMKLKCHIPV